MYFSRGHLTAVPRLPGSERYKTLRVEKLESSEIQTQRVSVTKESYVQETSVATDVPITTTAGKIALFHLTTLTMDSTSFKLTGDVIKEDSIIMANVVSYTVADVPEFDGLPVVSVGEVVDGEATVRVFNYSAVALDGDLVVSFLIV